MRKHIPNIITCCNLICGCIAVSNALLASVYLLDNPVSFRMRMTHYALAVAFMVLGAVFDFFDGMIARALGVSSPIGKELDSLADVITFGLAPSMMIFTLFQEVEYPAFMEPLRGIHTSGNQCHWTPHASQCPFLGQSDSGSARIPCKCQVQCTVPFTLYAYVLVPACRRDTALCAQVQEPELDGQ